MSCVVDASLWLRFLLREPGPLDWLDRLDRGALAPDFILAELANTLRRRARALGPIERAIDDTSRRFELVPMGALVVPAAALAVALDHAIYDCLYLALAAQRGVPLLTADSRFARKAEAAGHPIELC